MLEDNKNASISADDDQSTEDTKQTELTAKNFYDDGYINAYCQNPHEGKSEALRKAGYTGNFLAQDAYRIHGRLETKIKARTTALISSLDTLAATQLEAILSSTIEDVGYSNMSKAIQQGMDYSGRKVGDTLTVKHEEMTQEQRRERIEYLQEKNQQAAATKH